MSEDVGKAPVNSELIIGDGSEDTGLVQSLIQARDVPAVQKTKLTTIRSSRPDISIFAFEGIDDKRVFYHWIKQIDPQLPYEPFVCHGKDKVLELRKVVERDVNDLKRGVYFFIDRDYDDLKGDEPSENIFVTESYSFENVLVSSQVLEELLKVELHCHSEPECRNAILELFASLYSQFLEIAKPLNFKIFLARRCNISQIGHLPSRINQIAKVTLEIVESPQVDPRDLVALVREPTEEEIARHSTDFEELDARTRYRGKFALLFFSKVLDLLIADRNNAESIFFADLDREELVAKGPVTLDSMASKSALPAGLTEFLEFVKADSAKVLQSA